MKLSIIVPVFNEEKTIQSVLQRVTKLSIPEVEIELIVINDGSTDSTREKIVTLKKRNGFVMLEHTGNRGKGAAVRTGIQKATGEYILIQDADLEYNPKFIKTLMKPVLDGKAAVVYGTRLNRPPRFRNDERTLRFALHYFGNRALSFILSALYWQWVTDMETCYKLIPKIALKQIKLHATGFEFEPEVTVQLIKKGYTIYEVPISTVPRGYSEGKKLKTIQDGWKALWTILKYRISK